MPTTKRKKRNPLVLMFLDQLRNGIIPSEETLESVWDEIENKEDLLVIAKELMILGTPKQPLHQPLPPQEQLHFVPVQAEATLETYNPAIEQRATVHEVPKAPGVIKDEDGLTPGDLSGLGIVGNTMSRNPTG